MLSIAFLNIAISLKHERIWTNGLWILTIHKIHWNSDQYSQSLMWTQFIKSQVLWLRSEKKSRKKSRKSWEKNHKKSEICLSHGFFLSTSPISHWKLISPSFTWKDAPTALSGSDPWYPRADHGPLLLRWCHTAAVDRWSLQVLSNHWWLQMLKNHWWLTINGTRALPWFQLPCFQAG